MLQNKIVTEANFNDANSHEAIPKFNVRLIESEHISGFCRKG